jgi:ABC-2 type transport system permease protein
MTSFQLQPLSVLCSAAISAIVSLMLAEPLGRWLQRFSPMMSGLAVQRTVLRAESVPIGSWAGLGVATAWSAVALVAAIWLVPRRDA